MAAGTATHKSQTRRIPQKDIQHILNGLGIPAVSLMCRNKSDQSQQEQLESMTVQESIAPHSIQSPGWGQNMTERNLFSRSWGQRSKGVS